VTSATARAALRNAEVAPQLARISAATNAETHEDLSRRLILEVHTDLDSVESRWREFERWADCTPFQTFDWVAAWQRNIGVREGVIPVVAIGCINRDQIAFILPLALVPGRLTRRLCWLVQEMSDYTAPLLAPDFSRLLSADQFRSVWRELIDRLRYDPRLRPDWIKLEKMPQFVGAQVNPFTGLHVALHASGAHLTSLGKDWQTFYFAKRSAATRARDRAKLRNIAKYGEIRFVADADPEGVRAMIDALMKLKGRALASKGIPNIFVRPGRRDFFLDLASNPRTRHLVHVSRVQIGPAWAAVNFGLVFRDCYYHLVASFGEGEYARYGPGALHLRELMAYAISRGLRRFDFTIGDEPYKLEWCDTHLVLYDLIAAVSYRGWPASLYAHVRRSLKRFIKQTPLAWRVVCAARRMFCQLHTRSERNYC